MTRWGVLVRWSTPAGEMRTTLRELEAAEPAGEAAGRVFSELAADLAVYRLVDALVFELGAAFRFVPDPDYVPRVAARFVPTVPPKVDPAELRLGPSS